MHLLNICVIAASLAAAQSYSVQPLVLPKENSHDVVVYDLIGDLINSTIEGIRPNLPDPLEIDNIEINLPDGLLAGGLKVSELQVVGIQGFQLPVLDFDILKLSANFVFNLPKLNINTKYWSDLVLLELVPLYGEGKMNINIEQLSLAGSGGLDLSNGITKPQLKDLKIVLTLGEATFDLHGLLNDEEFSQIMSAVLNDAVDSFINEHQEAITRIISPIVETVLNLLLNSILGGGDSTELVNLLEQIQAAHVAAVKKMNSA